MMLGIIISREILTSPWGGGVLGKQFYSGQGLFLRPTQIFAFYLLDWESVSLLFICVVFNLELRYLIEFLTIRVMCTHVRTGRGSNAALAGASGACPPSCAEV